MTAKLMAILNATPDSYFTKSRYPDPDEAIKRGIAMHEEGADILDIGGESTRPGSEKVPLEEELSRVIPIIEGLKRAVPIPLSIDTMKPEVAQKALEAGAGLLNDVTGFSDPRMREIAATSQVPICVMHMLGNPKVMQQNPHYEEGVIPFLLRFFEERIESLLKAGVEEKQIILDPGIGFGKTVAHNMQILHNLPKIRSLGFPVLVGLSRKWFMHKLLEAPTEALLAPTLAMNSVALLNGADIIRVHDIKEHRMAIDILKHYRVLNE